MASVIRPIAFVMAVVSILFANPVTDFGLSEYVPQGLRNLPRTLRVLGVFRQAASTVIADPAEFVVIDDTVHCEDLHYHEASQLLFTACEGTEATRFSWFPPLAIRKDPSATAIARGSLHVIDPETMKARKLDLVQFDGPFVTHGIDVISDPARPGGEAVYIVAINHLPHPELRGETHSQVEIFYHEIGSGSARHMRSVWDPTITTPNDVVALSPTSIFVTNDHYHATGNWRKFEDVAGPKWTGTIHLQLARLEGAASAQDGVTASVALASMHNNNGIGHGRSQDEVLVVECVSGILNIGHVEGRSSDPTIKIDHRVLYDSPIDNPSFFRDPYANSTFDGSAYLAPGLTRAVDLHANVEHDPATRPPVPIMIWRTKRVTTSSTGQPEWRTELLFEDDGSRLDSVSAAVQIAIDPAEEDGCRKAWLFATGFLSRNVVAIKVDV
jgi:hypothetical protein